MVPHRVFSGLSVVPNELVDKIVEIMLAEGSNDQSHRKFARIASLTLSSSRLREIALRRFFHSLHPASSYHWSQLYNLLVVQGEQAFTWVRYVQVRRVLFCASRHAYMHIQGGSSECSHPVVGSHATALSPEPTHSRHLVLPDWRRDTAGSSKENHQAPPTVFI